MKKSLLVLALATVSSISAFAQSYYFTKTKGTFSPYTLNPPSNATTVVAGTAGAQTGLLSSSQVFPFGGWLFYGNPVTSFKVSTSGYLTFNTAMTVDSTNNVALPSTSAPIASIFAFWDNTKLQNIVQGNTFQSDIKTWKYGATPNQVFVVQWRLAQPTAATPNIEATYYAVRFYEAGGFDIIHNYGFGSAFSATAGVQNVTGTIGTQINGSPNLPAGGADSYDEALSDVYTFKYGTQLAYDVKMNSIDIPKFVGTGSSNNLGYTFTNNGSQVITSFRINYSVNGGAPVSQSITGESIIGSGIGTYSFAHSTPFVPATVGAKNIKMWVDNINGSNVDLNHSNDTASGTINVVNSTIARKPLLEVFTSSTCPPCLPGNEVIQSVLHERMGGYTVIKYQYNFPGTGDPYYTTEVASRGSYYGGINSVPRLQVDGKWNDNPNSFNTGIFDGYFDIASVVGIKANQTIVDKTITINAKVKPTGAFSGNYKIHFAVLEKITKKNKKSNGEREFHWVMKKMIPNAGGSTISFESDAEQTISKSFTFPGAFRLPADAQSNNIINLSTENSVEDMSNLIGVVFVQDEDSKDVLQSEWSGNNEWDYYAGVVQTTVGNTGVSLYPNPAQQTFTINATSITGAATVKVFDLTGKEVLVENVIGGVETTINCSDLNNGIYMIHVTANGNTAVQKLVISK